ncbi:PadR family transcriptional regulator [Diaminobutyricibacter tongyongensis]|uniref:PadR family transcriptional regulator n=1 Tax=Leifsonia tongyongensis TaxID=1268043 RepID=A0A6L9XY57_9MICO|nr:PadR family transcriptional regulator [Diaminobutyricibacter tongyongensis]NEN06372.1 PadR family transcriptional regulator [Diaminobutyricibacter tongyongensis]
MSSIDILILRHLRRQPAHGYELRKRVEETTGVVLHNNSLYPALKRFEEAGAVVKRSEEQEGRPARHVYSITPVGLELLHDMLAELPPESAGDDLEFLTRLGQFSLLEPAERLTILDARDAALETRIHHLTALLDRGRRDLWSRDVTTELIRRCEAERTWLAGLRDAAATAPLSED